MGTYGSVRLGRTTQTAASYDCPLWTAVAPAGLPAVTLRPTVRAPVGPNVIAGSSDECLLLDSSPEEHLSRTGEHEMAGIANLDGWTRALLTCAVAALLA